MAAKARPSINKRLKEQARQQKAREKAARRAERQTETRNRPDVDEGEDPDIAGIVPGPQPLPPGFE